MEKQALERRRPRQARALEKVSLMFEAAIRILEAEGLEALTTNRIAAVAGVSIGTLYQYFPHREALLEALTRREMAQVFEELARHREAADPLPAGEQRLRAIVRTLLGALGGRLRARHALLVALARSGRFEALLGETDALTAALLARNGDGSMAGTIDGFVLSRAVGGAIRGALLRDPAWLQSGEFEDALVRLIAGFVQGGRGIGSAIAPDSEPMPR
ncbi:MAG: helix-turn-helix domain-containing protein [Burkholderiaceae bacterium]